MPKYGLMHLLACFTLFDGEPQLVNTILDGFLAVTREEIQAVAKKYLRKTKNGRLCFARRSRPEYPRTQARRRRRNGGARVEVANVLPLDSRLNAR